jgi:hypothetical protein
LGERPKRSGKEASGEKGVLGAIVGLGTNENERD